MAKKKVTSKKKSAPKSDVNKTQEIKKALAATPDKKPKEISEALTAKGVDVSPAYVSTIKTNLKAKTGAPKKKAVKKKVAAKTKATKKRAPKVTPATDIRFEQLKKAKEMAQQLGGVEKAKETLAALAQLVD